MDESVSLTPEEKEVYISFGAIVGWIDKFNKCYRIASRAITIRCTKNIDQIRTYFLDSNQTMETLNQLTVYNMDETCVF